MRYTTIMGSYTERLLTLCMPSGEEVVIDLHEAMMQLTMDIVARALFDIDLQDSGPEVSHALGLVLKAYTTQMTSAFRHLLARLPLSLVPAVSPRLETAVQQLDGLIYCFIEEHRSAQYERDDLLSTLMAAQGEDGSRMTDQQVRDEVMTLFLAGHETTANLLSWLWYLLSLFPEQEDLLRQEACQVLGGRTPTLADLTSLPYTQQAIKETLRLYPPVWWISRETVEDWKLPEGTIPKGAEVGMSQWVMHRDPRFFEEPLRRKPERWHNDLEKRLPRQVYFPFGGGPHLCIGNAFAMMEASLIVATMIQRCHFERVERLPLEPEASLTLRPKHALQVMVQWRKGLCCNTTCVASPFAQRIISPLR
jgi:cytochrome P450